MKAWVFRVFYGVFVLLALAGGIQAIRLYASHAANGTSVGYFTVIVFPTLFLLLGLTGIRFRYWWCIGAVCWLGIGVLLCTAGPWDPMLMMLLVGYLLLGGLSGVCGSFLRCQRNGKKE